MKLNAMKKWVSFALCALFAFVAVPTSNAFAALDDIPLQGGSYKNIYNSTAEYRKKNPQDHTVYGCHYLISKSALNQWKNYLITEYHDAPNFLTSNVAQNWAPVIVMEQADLEKTLSYHNPFTKTREQNQKAINYINEQANRIIWAGDLQGIIIDEINFIRNTFGHKYDRALAQVWDYVQFLKFEHPTNSTLKMRNPIFTSQNFEYDFGKNFE